MKESFLFKRLIIITVIFGLLTSCHDPAGNNPNDNPNEPNNNNKTYIQFDNTQGICAVSVYKNSQRREEDKIAVIPVDGNSEKIKWTPSAYVPFYYTYSITLKGISNFIIDYIPEIGKDQNAARIDAEKTTTIKIPTLSETISSPDKLLSDKSYLLIQNNSSYPFELHRGPSTIPSDNLSDSLVNSGERAQYTINPGLASPYKLLVWADYKEFPSSIVSFEAGHVYIFDYNGSISLVSDTELKLINVNGIDIPKLPAAPVVITSNGSLTLQWTAVGSATAYEIWMSTVNNSDLATKYGADVVASLSTTISGLNNGTIYYFWIKAKNILGTSGFSPVVAGIPSAATTKPPDPKIAPSIMAGNGQFTISWQAVEDASVYEVWTGTTNNVTNATKQGGDISGFSTVITGLNNGTTYYVWIKAKNNIGVSGFSPSTTGKPLGTPGMPTINSSSEKLLVTWTIVSGAEQYEVYYGIESPTILAITTTGTMATITGLVNGETYYICLRAKNASGVSDYGQTAIGIPIGNTTSVTVSSGDCQLSLNWSAITGADQYEVYYNTSNSIPSNPAQTVTTNTAVINGLINGTTYYIWVKSKNANGTGNASTVAIGKPLGTPGIPTVNSAFKGLLVTWTAVAGAEQYEVYYGIGTSITLAVTTTSTTAAISGLTASTTYNVQLRAKNANGFSEFGPIASGVTNDNLTPGLYRKNVRIGQMDIASSLSFISTNAESGDEYYIVLGANESITSKTLNYSGKKVNITLMGYDRERTITLNRSGSMFVVNSGVTLTLEENITLVGRSSNSDSLVIISGGKLIMNNGSNITGNEGGSSDNNYNGGGIYVTSNGDFTMNGGQISGNSIPYGGNNGGGIYVNNGTFTMNNGEISGNTSRSGNGIYVNSNGTFIMNDGKISGNNSYSSGGGGGVYIVGSFTMNGGEISGNTTTYNGGGVYVSGTFNMNGGKISNNSISFHFEAYPSYGGGVYVSSDGTFTKSGNSTITGYSSDTINGNVVKKDTGLIIQGNGHAVYVDSYPIRRRETTAGPGVNLDSRKSGTGGEWEN